METIEIKSTTDYEQFKFLDTNRKVGSNKKVKKSIEKMDLED